MTIAPEPRPTPEGRLIRHVRNLSIPKLTIPAAAARIGLSAEQWGYIERSYYPARDGNPPRPFSPPAATLAKMAYALRIAPERLESEGQRPDAAEILREILRQEGGAAAAPEPPPYRPRATAEMEPAMEKLRAGFEIRALSARREHPGERLTGEMVFLPDADMPPTMRDAAIWYWDQFAALGWDEDRIPAGVAAALTLDEEKAKLRAMTLDEQAATAQEKGCVFPV